MAGVSRQIEKDRSSLHTDINHLLLMHSSAAAALHATGHHHYSPPTPHQQQPQHQSSLGFGQLPQSTYDGGQPVQRQELAYSQERDPQNPGTIRWSANGVSTSAERRLPFVHRFRPVPAQSQPQTYNGSTVQTPSTGQHQHHYHSSNQGRSYQQQQQQHILRQQQQQEKRARNMAQYETNPIGALQERFQARGMIPEYRFLQTDGASHCPVFTFEVKVGGITACGSGQTKKMAKQAAARAMLDIIDGRAPAPVESAPNGVAQEAKTESTDNGTPKEPAKDKKEGASVPPTTVGNKIGMLQEHCVTHGLPMPIYDLTDVGGQPHQRTFTMAAKIGCISVVGSGTSKKDAKREAATKMWDKLRVLGPSALPIVTGAKDVGQLKNKNEENSNLSGEIDKELASVVADIKIETITPKASKAIQAFYSDLNAGVKGSCLYELHRNPLRSGQQFVKMLMDLGEEQHFAATFVDVDEPTDAGEVQCLVQLSTMPVAVCYGVGQSLNAAKDEAARNALNYLKMMTKKNFNNANFTPAAAAGEAGNNKVKDGQRKGGKKGQ